MPVNTPTYSPRPVHTPPRRTPPKRQAPPRVRQQPVWVLAAANLAVTGVCLCIFALFHHVLPVAQSGTGTVIDRPSGGNTSSSGGISPDASSDAPSDNPSPDQSGWGAKFADKFSDTVEQTDHSYRSKDVSITIEKKTMGEGSRLVTYYVADIYVRSIDNFRTAFAKDQYGRGFRESTLTMATRNNALLAISGDYYGNHTNGTIIRNGVLYRDNPIDGDVCVLYYDGTMETYSPQEWNSADAVAKGAYQAWSFGPMLLDRNGQAMESFNSSLNPKNPRSSMGYYEPGHYCFVLVDGRQEGYSAGLTLKELSQVYADLGCKAAYNLDGGQTAVMTFGDREYSQPYNGGRPVSDIVYIGEVSQ